MLIRECDSDTILRYLRRIRFENKETVVEAIDLGWKPNIDDAINRYYTVCAELEIGEGYAEHFTEEHSYKDVLQALTPIFVDQAEDFLAEQE